ncbi:hypothetical protein [Pontiella desulfatans]|uniref:hypothetical protein n=1 Tax=Pontiella desulfatans TaxID=2750659 RepID=UPI00109C546B|nr:hypothetical protein [Pontiella desulfatans]
MLNQDVNLSKGTGLTLEESVITPTLRGRELKVAPPGFPRKRSDRYLRRSRKCFLYSQKEAIAESGNFVGNKITTARKWFSIGKKGSRHWKQEDRRVELGTMRQLMMTKSFDDKMMGRCGAVFSANG